MMKKEPIIFLLALISAIWIFYSISYKEKSQQSDFKNFDWMEGAWTYKDDSLTISEDWEVKDGSLMEGSSLTLLNGDTIEKEYLRIIKMDLDYFYIAKPLSKSPTLFKMDLDTNKTVRFISPGNKFPESIQYEKKNDSLNVILLGEGNVISYKMGK